MVLRSTYPPINLALLCSLVNPFLDLLESDPCPPKICYWLNTKIIWMGDSISELELQQSHTENVEPKFEFLKADLDS